MSVDATGPDVALARCLHPVRWTRTGTSVSELDQTLVKQHQLATRARLNSRVSIGNYLCQVLGALGTVSSFHLEDMSECRMYGP